MRIARSARKQKKTISEETRESDMMDKFIAFLAGEPHKMDEDWQQTWAYFVGCKMPHILRDWYDSTFKEGDVWKKDGAYYENVRQRLAAMSAFREKCVDEDETLRALKLLVEFFADEKSKEEQEKRTTGLPKRGGRVKKLCAKEKDKDFDNLVASISKMAKSLAGLYEQACALLKPIIDDACRNPGSYGEKEIERIFEQILNVSCCRKGKRLFDRLCKCFMPIYPDVVRFYINADKEMYGDENDT